MSGMAGMPQRRGLIFNVHSRIASTLLALCAILPAGGTTHADARDLGSPVIEAVDANEPGTHVFARLQVDGIQGHVREVGADGPGIVGADITIRRDDGTLFKRLKSRDGGFFLVELPVGLYRITAEKSGFRTVTKSFLKDGPGLDTLDFQMSRPVASPPPPPVSSSPTLSLKISALRPHESLPLVLRFELDGGTQLSPLELRYSVTAAFGTERSYEESPFFSDVVQLLDVEVPGTLEVRPGLTFPPEATAVRVQATASYLDTDVPGDPKEAEANTDIALQIAPGYDPRYVRYRDGYIRRHLTSTGRNLSGIWLKEYEPGLDRKELLYHSRVSREPNDHVRVYVPWCFSCPEANKLPRPASIRELDQRDWCGSSIMGGADALYGGHENPMGRGGRAAAAFALEYLTTGHLDSLNHGLQFLKWAELAEWHDESGTPTGFFLRTDYSGSFRTHPEKAKIWPERPGEAHTYGCESCREYYPASLDELVGLILGLRYLHEALERAVSAREAPDLLQEPFKAKQSLVALAQRLGTYLRRNHYVLLPPDGFPGKPNQLPAGWNGAFPFEWFINRALHTITGEPYLRPTRKFNDDIAFWRRLRQYTTESQRILFHTADKFALSPASLAEYLVTGLGAVFAESAQRGKKLAYRRQDKTSASLESLHAIGRRGLRAEPSR